MAARKRADQIVEAADDEAMGLRRRAAKEVEHILDSAAGLTQPGLVP